MIDAVSKVFVKTVAIINTGYPIEMSWINELGIDAVIYTGFAGMGAGYALMEILDGRTNLSGKLPDTWSLDSIIMTDWGTYDTVDPVEMVKAGNCWLTEGGRKYVRILQKAVKEGRLSRAALEQNVRYVVKTILKLIRHIQEQC